MREAGSKSGTSEFGKPRAFGRYRLLVPVCIDSIGETWVGHIAAGNETGRPVLITLIEEGVDALPLRPILEAARHAKQMRDPSLLALLDVAPFEEGVGIVSEYLEGEPLTTFLSIASAQGVRVPPPVAFVLVRDVVNALIRLRAEHWEELSPGSLGPEFIFITSFGEAVLRQPTVLCAASQGDSYRRHPNVLPFRSPESLRDSRDSEESSDVFSLGVMLWELITGRSLFFDHLRLGRFKRLPEEALREIERRVLDDLIPSLSEPGVLEAGAGPHAGAIADSGVMPISTPRPHQASPVSAAVSAAVSSPISATDESTSGVLHPEGVRLVSWCLEREPDNRPRSLEDLKRALDALPPSLVAEPMDVAQVVQEHLGPIFKHRDPGRHSRLERGVTGTAAPLPR